MRQIEIAELDSGEIFAVGHGKGEKRFKPIWSRHNDEERVINPFNSSRTPTLCHGVRSRGVRGEVRTLTDAQVRDANGAFLARFPHREFGQEASASKPRWER